MEQKVLPRTGIDVVLSRLAAIVESSNDAIVSKNLDGTITTWNQAAKDLFGYEPEEIIGRSILAIIPDDLHGEEFEILRKIRAGERIEHYETRRVRKDGEIVEVSLTISPIRDGSGKVIGSSKIARDISDRKSMERQLIRSEKLAATGRMAAWIAHEVNNPLDSVLNLVYLARTSVAKDSPASSYLLTAERELDRVAQIARKTLSYYREPGVPVELRIEEIFDEILLACNPRLIAKNIAVDCKFNHRDPLFSSKDDLVQVFVNLLTNAMDAMPQGGSIRITTVQTDRKGIEVSLKDTGIGISREHLDKVFDPFFTTKGQNGTGVGLWVARQLVEKHAGSILIESKTKSPENGTTVRVFLPFERNVMAKGGPASRRK